MSQVAQSLGAGLSLPFARYPGAGRTMLGPPPQGDATARHGYGTSVFTICGYTCVYCGLDMAASYATWLQLSVDHVLPRSLADAGWNRAWIEDRANLVTSCRACNDFTNGYRVTDAAPLDPEAFITLRDRHFVAKLALAQAAHAREQVWFRAHGPQSAPVPVPRLMRQYADLLATLHRRGVMRTENNPVADYAEELVARTLTLTRGTGTTQGYDGIDAAGVRYQVKARRLTPAYMNRQLGFIRDLDKDLFEVLVGVLFNPDFSVLRAAAIPVEIVRARVRTVGYVNGSSFYLSDAVWEIPGVVDLSDRLRMTAEAWV